MSVTSTTAITWRLWFNHRDNSIIITITMFTLEFLPLIIQQEDRNRRIYLSLTSTVTSMIRPLSVDVLLVIDSLVLHPLTLLVLWHLILLQAILWEEERVSYNNWDSFLWLRTPDLQRWMPWPFNLWPTVRRRRWTAWWLLPLQPFVLITIFITIITCIINWV